MSAVANFDNLRTTLELSVRGAIHYFDEENKQEVTKLIQQAIAEYSVYWPRKRSTTLTLLAAEADLDLPLDYLGFISLSVDGSPYYVAGAEVDFESGNLNRIGDVLIYPDAGYIHNYRLPEADTEAALFYYGQHEEDGSSLRPRDVENVKPCLLYRAYDALVSARNDVGRVEVAGIMMMVPSDTEAMTWQNARDFWFKRWEKIGPNRAYATYSAGRFWRTRPTFTMMSAEQVS